MNSRSRFQRSCRRLANRSFGLAILSYAFVSVYRFLYGADPAVVPRVGTTIAVLGGVGVVLFGGIALVLAVAEWTSEVWQRWHPRVVGKGGVR